MSDETKSIVTHVLRYLESKNLPLTKIAIQKCLFFLKDLGLPVRPKFIPYLYGPYSKDLSNILDDMVFWDELEERGNKYKIEKLALDSHDDLKAEVEKGLRKIEKLTGGKFGFRLLELYGTGLYCYRALEAVGLSDNEEDFVSEFKEWKNGKFLKNEIKKCYKKIQEVWLN